MSPWFKSGMFSLVRPSGYLFYLLLGVLSLLSPSLLGAAPTTELQARQIVENWLTLNPRPLEATLGEQVREVVTYRDQSGDPVYYIVYLHPQGFVIVPADDLVEPIIGFVSQGLYDPSPTKPLGDLVSHDVPGRIARMRASEKEAATGGRTGKDAALMEEAQRKWAILSGAKGLPENLETGLSTISDVRVNPFVQSRWGQGNEGSNQCYNLFTPGNRVCGCVATAMAQLMRFWQHPGVGVGTASFNISVCGGTPYPEALMGGNGTGGPYDWANMVLDPDGTTGLVQRQAIGRLTHDAGVAVNMDYCTESGADALDAANAFTGTFGYSNARRGYNSGNEIPSVQRNAMINPNLDARYPVLLGIRGGTWPNYRGHAIICDGYGYDLLTLYHHLNMGWSGSDDAWYNLPNIDSSPSFDVLRKIVYNVYPTGSGEIISGRVAFITLPFSGAQVTATRLGSGQAYTATTDAKGIYALARLPGSSSYLINVNYPGFVFTPLTVTIGASTNDTTTVGNVWGANISAFLDGSIPLGQALDNPRLTFNKFGHKLWYGQDTVWKYGGSAARSGAIDNLQATWMETLVQGPAFVSFYWKVSSEQNFDYLRVSVGGDIKDQISGEQDWQLKRVFVPKGTHAVKWEYSKDWMISAGSDCGWVDRVSILRTPTGVLELLLLQ